MSAHSKRIATTLPLRELWDDGGRTISAEQIGRLIDAERVRDLLRTEHVRFVVADCGLALRWILDTQIFRFWKDEVRMRVCHEPAYLEDYPGEYCYCASEWRIPDGAAIILLEVWH